MADLMSGSHTFSSLANKYGNFHAPAVKLLLDGSNILPLNNGGIKELKLSLSLHCASAAEFKIAGAYDRKARTFNNAIKDKLTLGKTMEIELGYLSSTLKIFKGFISSVVMDYSEDPILTVTVMDARRLMMQSNWKERYFDDKNYSDIVSAVMSPYSKLCSVEQESSSDNLLKPVFQKMSDYLFITEDLAKKTNKEFFILGDTAYFRKPKSVTSEVITLEYGLNLLAFQRQSDYLHCKVIAGSYDKKEQKAITSELEVKNSDTQTAVLSTAPLEISIQEDAETEAELKTRVEEIGRQKIDKVQNGSGKCIGIPEIVPGRYIKLDKLDSDANQKYYIVEVRHHFGEEGYYTEFETEGWT